MYNALASNGTIEKELTTHKWARRITSKCGTMLIAELDSKNEVLELSKLIKNVTKNSGFIETDASYSIREYTLKGETIVLYIHYKNPLKYNPPNRN